MEIQNLADAEMAFGEMRDARGALVALEDGSEIPFAVKRVYYIYNTQFGQSRGFHAHKALRQMAICLSGSCVMVLDNGRDQLSLRLDSPTKAALIEPMVWHEMHEFEEDTVLMVLASDHYDESDYIRNRSEFDTVVSLGNSNA